MTGKTCARYDARMSEDHELETLLGLDGFEFQFVRGYRVKNRSSADHGDEQPSAWDQVQPDIA